MPFFISLLILLSFELHAATSLLIPAFLKAIPFLEKSDSYVLEPEIRSIVSILKNKQIESSFLQKFLVLAKTKTEWPLPNDDLYDSWIKNPSTVMHDNLEISLQAVGVYVKEEADDVFNDDLYAYFFVTDGLITTGKVTGIYQGLDEGESFFFSSTDRILFPVTGGAKVPAQHLIIDYGLVESDGDDIKKLQKLSAVMVDMAMAVYAALDPQSAQVLFSLRKEVKALADLLISFENDDRLVTSTFGFKTDELDLLLRHQTVVSFKRKHKKKFRFNSWEYELMFRLLRI